MSARPCQFKTKWREASSGAVARDGEYPCEAEIGEGFGFSFVCEEPAEVDAPLWAGGFLDDLFGAGELFITGHLTGGIAEGVCRERGQTYGVEVFWAGFGCKSENQRWAGTGVANGTPEAEELFGGKQNAGLVESLRSESGRLQHGRHTDSQLLQLRQQAAGNPEVFAHRRTIPSSMTMPSVMPCR